MTKPPKMQRASTRGMIEILALFVVFMLCITLATGLIFNRAASMMSETVDRLRQGSVERQAIEQITRETILQKLETAPINSASSPDALVDSMLANYNAGAKSITLSRNGSSPSLAGINNQMFPAGGLPAISGPDLTAAGNSFQLKRVLGPGAATIGAPVAFNFTKTVTNNTLENRTYTVTAQAWSVPLSNWSFVGYGLPASGAVPVASPTGASSVLASSSFVGGGGRGLLVTTLRPNPPYGSGDPTAFNQLYSAPGAGQPETLPAFYRNYVSLAWNAWEYVWAGGIWPLSSYTSGYYQDRLMNYAMQSTRNTGASRLTPATLDMVAFAQPPITGVTMTGTSATVDLGTYPEDILYIVDGAGGYVVNLTAAASDILGPLVVVVSNQGVTPTTINISGTNSRTVLLYVRNSAVACVGGSTFNGGILLDRSSSITGGINLVGMFAFYAGDTAVNPLPGFSLNLTPPTGTVQSDLLAIAPRALVVSTTSVLN